MSYEGKHGKQKEMKCLLDYPEDNGESSAENSVWRALARVAVCGKCPNLKKGKCKKPRPAFNQLVQYINANPDI